MVISSKRNYLISYIKTWSKVHNRVPRKCDFDVPNGEPNAKSFSRVFGSWSKALKVARLIPRKPYGQKGVHYVRDIRIGFKITQNGYRWVYKPEHPKTYDGIYVAEHRLRMEQHIGRFLHHDEIVHHKDHNPLNNDITNLLLISPKEHVQLHKPYLRRQ